MYISDSPIKRSGRQAILQAAIIKFIFYRYSTSNVTRFMHKRNVHVKRIPSRPVPRKWHALNSLEIRQTDNRDQRDNAN